MNQRKAIALLSRKNLLSLFVMSFLFAALGLLLPLNQAYAESGLVLSTRYPGVSAQAGEKITFPLKIKNNGSVSQVFNLEITSKPDNWEASLRGNGREIEQVFADGQGYANVDLLVNIPEDIKDGEYPLTITAKSQNGNLKDSLKIIVKITQAKTGNDALAAKYSELKGPNDATFNFKIDLTNNGSNEQIYNLGAQVQEGWQVSFKPSYENQQVASIGVKPGETISLDVQVKPPVNAEAGDYVIPIQAVSPVGTVAEDLKIVISGTYKMEFSTASGQLNTDIVAGREKKVNLEIKNTGSAPLNNINFSSVQPPNWSVSFEPKSVDVLNPGENRQITATIFADEKAIAGDYLVSLDAYTQEVKSSADLRTTVKTSTVWGIVGLLVVLIVVFAVYKAFQIYGRR